MVLGSKETCEIEQDPLGLMGLTTLACKRKLQSMTGASAKPGLVVLLELVLIGLLNTFNETRTSVQVQRSA